MAEREEYLVGTGIADVTGEAGGVGMMGYAMPQQRTAGIHLRQWARAFVVAESREGGKRIAFVSTDSAMIFIAVHQEVMRRLQDKFGGKYTTQNTVLSATHNHSGPGGYSHYPLYNVTTLGFRPKTFEAIVSGIVTAIERADADLAPGSVRVNQGELFGANVNRALMAFERNPAAEKADFPGAVDPSMTVLRFERNGRPVGVFSWFATHGTSMKNNNRLISSDNKGYAAYLWEHDWAGRSSLSKAEGEPGFVAGFAQGNAGDMSPNVGAGEGYGPADNHFANTRIVGSRQALKARELFDSATEEISGPIDYRQRYVDFSHIELDPEFAPEGVTRTWPAVMGQAFTGGCFDGRGLKFIKQGDLRRNPLFRPLDLVGRPASDVIEGHSPKPFFLATGLCPPIPWTPPVLPLQIIRIGQLAIVAGPGEFTITSGRRIREVAAAALGGLVSRVVFAGYANAYSGYITTPEEYSAQLYEGSSTHFGPGTLPAYQQEFQRLARAMAADDQITSEVEPPDLSRYAWSVDPAKRIFDVARRDAKFGDVLTEPAAFHKPGDVVEAKFVSASPNNDLKNGSSFLRVERRNGNEWILVASDDDWETMFRWRRTGVGTSTAEVSWRIPESTPKGRYRLVHLGTARTKSGAEQFVGATQEFEVLPG